MFKIGSSYAKWFSGVLAVVGLVSVMSLEGTTPPAGRVLVKYEPGLAVETISAIEARFSLVARRRLPVSGLTVYEVPAKLDPVVVAKQLSATFGVALAEVDQTLDLIQPKEP
jgi:hypothetical protein